MSIERIKFRAQNPITKKWETVESFAEYWPDRPRETHAERLALFFDSCNGVNLDPTTVGQWTGLVDSKGVEIYEGDILSVIDPNDEKVEDWIVEYQDSSTCFPIEVSMDDFDVTTLGWAKGFGFILEIIGNVHEVTT